MLLADARLRSEPRSATRESSSSSELVKPARAPLSRRSCGDVTTPPCDVSTTRRCWRRRATIRSRSSSTMGCWSSTKCSAPPRSSCPSKRGSMPSVDPVSSSSPGRRACLASGRCPTPWWVAPRPSSSGRSRKARSPTALTDSSMSFSPTDRSSRRRARRAAPTSSSGPCGAGSPKRSGATQRDVRGSSPRTSAICSTAADFRHLHHLRSRAPERFHLGVVLYSGADDLSFGNGMVAAPLEALCRSAAGPSPS